MKKLSLVLCLLVGLISTTYAQMSQESGSGKSAEIVVHYLENYPFAYRNEAGELMGIEIDIMEQFSKWLKETKGYEKVKMVFLPHTDFAKVYAEVKGGKGPVIGLASVTVTKERQQEVSFSAPYLKNISLLISNTEVPSLRNYDEMSKLFGEMTAVVNRGTVAERHLMEVKKKHYPTMRVNYVERPQEVVERVAENKGKYFGYVDLLTYWAYLKDKPANLKIHRVATLDQQRFAMILPKGSEWQLTINEFMESGFGFTATEVYAEILKKHLGYEVVKSVELY